MASRRYNAIMAPATPLAQDHPLCLAISDYGGGGGMGGGESPCVCPSMNMDG